MASGLGYPSSSSAQANTSSQSWNFSRNINTSFSRFGPVPNEYASRSRPPFTKGYFAIPFRDDSLQDTKSFFSVGPLPGEEVGYENEDDASQHPSTPDPESQSPEEHLKQEARLRRLEKERAIAEAGEVDWVRSGGILRDANGNRDLARTNRIREELRLEAEEKRLREQWDLYQQRWQALKSSQEPLRFSDVPWPLPTTPTSVEEFTEKKIEDFIMSPLKIRGNKVTPKGRLRSSMLRWHPDKLGSVIARVIPEEQANVKEGIGVVFRYLKALQDAKTG
ncbi:hypothetical protein NEOLEDRAFT_960081 [Neolentinus lepideus HHB14362 ss-1]|uniref:Uncharacterized protein n=1 Tax=Neolentinus lepideus HHB14362 ss-1 TaxID=1314782 RepID=A0A165UGF4_9AGAM|nr:hypothetical protein NEOLEDRAFT_960081 [Neolentinus lepideus HHB14362 ss-1]